MNKYCTVLLLLALIFSLSAKDIELKPVISSKPFYMANEKVTLDGSKSIYPKRNKKVLLKWSLIDEAGEEYAKEFTGEKFDISLPEGKYGVKLTISLAKQSVSETTEIFVAEKDEVTVTFKLYPPIGTPDSDYIFIAHEQPGIKDWTPYATQMERKDDGLWYADFKLKSGKVFKFQPTRGSWANKARDPMDSDYIVRYIPFRDEVVELKDFTWGKLVENPKLIRQPLLVPANEDFTSLKLVWNTENTELLFGESGKQAATVEIMRFEHGMEAVFKNLVHGKIYYYQFGTDGKKQEFRIPDNDGKFVFAAGTDGQNIKSTIEASAKRMVSYNPELIVLAGDMMNNGLKSSSWEMTFFKPFVPFIEGIPVISSTGNHEEGSVLFNKYWGKKYNWDTIVCENTRFLIIDVEGTFMEGSIQYRFIEETLKKNKEKWLIVVMHESPYAFIPRHYSNLLARQLLSPLFEKYKVNLVLAGHNHVYERTLPINGVTYVTLPCLGSNKPKEALEPKNQLSAVQVFNKDGFAIVNVDNNKIEVKVETHTGEPMDSFIINTFK